MIPVVCLNCCTCSLFRSHIAPYPTGVIFPVVQSQEISFDGEPSELLQRVNDSLIVATEQGMVSAYSGLSRELLWQFQTQAPRSTPLFRGREGLYIVDQQNTVYSLNFEGKLLWKSSLPEAVTGGICEDEIQIYMGAESGRFFALAPLFVPLPFLGLGLFVAGMQTFVFLLLTLVYMQMAVSHDH